MQILINQAEIEQAIKAYIHHQITIKPGMEVSVELTSGRGENGFRAAIDITPIRQAVPGSVEALARPAAPPAAQAPAATPAPVPAASVTSIFKKPAPVEAPAPAVIQEDEAPKAPSQEAKDEPPFEVNSTSPGSAEGEAEAPAPKADAENTENTESTAQSPARALFKNFRKPVNG